MAERVALPWPVTRDSAICGGQVTIQGRGIRVETVYRRWLAGESVRALVRDYGLQTATVEATLRWAGNAGIPFWRAP